MRDRYVYEDGFGAVLTTKHEPFCVICEMRDEREDPTAAAFIERARARAAWIGREDECHALDAPAAVEHPGDIDRVPLARIIVEPNGQLAAMIEYCVREGSMRPATHRLGHEFGGTPSLAFVERVPPILRPAYDPVSGEPYAEYMRPRTISAVIRDNTVVNLSGGEGVAIRASGIDVRIEGNTHG